MKKPETRSIQEIFDVVIKGGFYEEFSKSYRSSSLMCYALRFAFRAGAITSNEGIRARKIINRYLGNCHGTLEGALCEAGHKYSFKVRKAIYLNWINRPKLR